MLSSWNSQQFRDTIGLKEGGKPRWHERALFLFDVYYLFLKRNRSISLLIYRKWGLGIRSLILFYLLRNTNYLFQAEAFEMRRKMSHRVQCHFFTTERLLRSCNTGPQFDWENGTGSPIAAGYLYCGEARSELTVSLIVVFCPRHTLLPFRSVAVSPQYPSRRSFSAHIDPLKEVISEVGSAGG